MNLRSQITAGLCCLCALNSISAQESQVTVVRPSGPFVVRPYKGVYIPPVELGNQSRLASLVRAGKLYLTVQDAIALAVENNLDLEVDRYGPLAAEWQVERAEAGGPLRGVTTGNNLVNQVTGGQGVVGSQVAAGLSTTGGTVNNTGGGAIVSQIGPVTANLDPVLQNATAFVHQTTPQPNPIQSQTAALVDTRHIYNTFVQQGLLSGGYVQATLNESYLKENTPTDVLNPSVAPVAQIYLRHNFLQGFGTGVNSRFIRVAKRNVIAARQTFESQLLNLVTNVLDLYWDLASSAEELKARQQSLNVASKFFEDTRAEISIGAIARVELYRAEAEFNARQRETAIAQATFNQQSNLLKAVLSRTGVADPLIEEAEIVPLDTIQIPEQDDLPPLRQLVASAVAHRPDVALAKVSDEIGQISALGTANGILPVLQGIASVGDSGLAGVPIPQADGSLPFPGYVGGFGAAIGQVGRHNYGNRRAALLFQATVGNNIAQGDYGVDQLQLRQGDLVGRRNMNQIVVEISNQMVAIRQARARFGTAHDTRVLEEQLLEKEQQKFQLGSSSLDDIIAVQRLLANARTAEVAAVAAYSRARVSIDQVLGLTLERNHVSVAGALVGRTTP